ncbi:MULTISPECIES: hypothetical protein [unclassified Microbulbifer]|uniref:hypothetical protein n=1 Tax=unclassified Microbulbifer TaxID=2619833 RepID=UPI0027E41E58|nr:MULTISPECIES: hypothetical protein [unclassified Microbulbifer]
MYPKLDESVLNCRSAAALLLLGYTPFALADGVVVDKVYDPYVQPLETEIEWRAVALRDDEDESLDSLQLHRLGLGRSFSDRWFGEVYLIGERNEDESFRLQGVELEAKWQLTEQGEYAADWGLLFELEKERDGDEWEAATTLLVAREWGRWVGTANLAAIYEWGDDIDNELESQLRMQARYRLSEAFEPAVELYAGQDTLGIGPVARGLQRLSGARQFYWELGLILGVTDESPDQTLRLLVEYEFY